MQGPGRDPRRNWQLVTVQIAKRLSQDRESRQVCVALGFSQAQQGQ